MAEAAKRARRAGDWIALLVVALGVITILLFLVDNAWRALSLAG